MHITPRELLDKVNLEYARRKAAKRLLDPAYTAPEAMPEVSSDQVLALIEVVADLINRIEAERGA